MHPAIISQVAVQQAYQARLLSHQVAAQVQLQNRTHIAAILAGLSDRELCQLSDSLVLALGAQTTARQLLISGPQQQHILARRALVSMVDANLAAYRIADALANARYLKQPKVSGVWEIVGPVQAGTRHLCVAIKLVPKPGGGHQWWVRTSFPIGRKKLRQLLATGSLVELNVGGGLTSA
jgi:hypothetical protein